MPGDDVPYPGDYAIWAFKLCAQAIATMPRAKTEPEPDPIPEKTGRRAAIEAQKKRRADAG